MKTLYILRHGKAERDSDSGEDFDRSLAKRGWRDAEAVGREMRSRGLEPDAVLSSPARRAAETVEALANGYGKLQPAFDPEIYNAPASRLLEIVKGADAAARRLLIVGHNPGFEDLAMLLDDGEGDYADRIADGLPTAGLVVLDLDVDRWNEVGNGAGRIAAVIVPKDLR